MRENYNETDALGSTYNDFVKRAKELAINMTEDTERELFNDYMNGKEVCKRNHIIEGNLMLLVHMAKPYTYRDCDIMDIIGAGSIGLIKTVEMFDINCGYRFSTYACKSIGREMSRYFAQKCKVVRVPERVLYLKNDIDKLQRLYREKNGHDISESELAKELCVPIDNIIEANRPVPKHCSLNSYVRGGEEGDIELLDNIIDEEYIKPFEEAENIEDIKHAVEFLLDKLIDPDEYLIRLKYGIGCEEKTTNEIAEIFKCTRQNIDQKYKKILKKLKMYANYSDRICKNCENEVYLKSLIG